VAKEQQENSLASIASTPLSSQLKRASDLVVLTWRWGDDPERGLTVRKASARSSSVILLALVTLPGWGGIPWGGRGAVADGIGRGESGRAR